MRWAATDRVLMPGCRREWQWSPRRAVVESTAGTNRAAAVAGGVAGRIRSQPLLCRGWQRGAVFPLSGGSGPMRFLLPHRSDVAASASPYRVADEAGQENAEHTPFLVLQRVGGVNEFSLRLPALQRLMGHANIETTLLYIQISPRDVYEEY